MSRQTLLGTLHNYSEATCRYVGDKDGRSNAQQYKMCDTLTSEERAGQWWSDLLLAHQGYIHIHGFIVLSISILRALL